ncbi:hypothetical protein NB709_003006 [Xanthomonas sacchari]|nr:hypothetical protein [Xanthomonas sacchari]
MRDAIRSRNASDTCLAGRMQSGLKSLPQRLRPDCDIVAARRIGRRATTHRPTGVASRRAPEPFSHRPWASVTVGATSVATRDAVRRFDAPAVGTEVPPTTTPIRSRDRCCKGAFGGNYDTSTDRRRIQARARTLLPIASARPWASVTVGATSVATRDAVRRFDAPEVGTEVPPTTTPIRSRHRCCKGTFGGELRHIDRPASHPGARLNPSPNRERPAVGERHCGSDFSRDARCRPALRCACSRD